MTLAHADDLLDPLVEEPVYIITFHAGFDLLPNPEDLLMELSAVLLVLIFVLS